MGTWAADDSLATWAYPRAPGINPLSIPTGLCRTGTPGAHPGLNVAAREKKRRGGHGDNPAQSASGLGRTQGDPREIPGAHWGRFSAPPQTTSQSITTIYHFAARFYGIFSAHRPLPANHRISPDSYSLYYRFLHGLSPILTRFYPGFAQFFHPLFSSIAYAQTTYPSIPSAKPSFSQIPLPSCSCVSIRGSIPPSPFTVLTLPPASATIPSL